MLHFHLFASDPAEGKVKISNKNTLYELQSDVWITVGCLCLSVSRRSPKKERSSRIEYRADVKHSELVYEFVGSRSAKFLAIWKNESPETVSLRSQVQNVNINSESLGIPLSLQSLCFVLLQNLSTYILFDGFCKQGLKAFDIYLSVW